MKRREIPAAFAIFAIIFLIAIDFIRQMPYSKIKGKVLQMEVQAVEKNNKSTCRNAKLQDARQTAGMPQSQLAEAAGISVRILQDYERGARDINGAKLTTLLKICNALECSLWEIITDPATLEGLDTYDKRRR